VANWKTIHSRINKFLWNKAYTGNTAPYRIKKTILETEVQKGGFGMVEIKKVVTALRIRRHLWLLEYNVHPLHDLLHLLIDPGDYLCTKLELDIDEITQLNLLTLQAKRLKDYESPEWLLETDLILHASLIRTRLENLVRPRKLNGTELRELKRLGASTLQDVLTAPRHYFDKLAKIIRNELKKVIAVIARQPVNQIQPNNRLMDKQGRWLQVTQLNSKTIREILYNSNNIAQPKITTLDENIKITYLKNIGRLRNVANKTKMLRLLHGDVYTAERRVLFNMSDSDRCRRCSEQETITHLLTDCPYTIEVFTILRIQNVDVNTALGTTLGPYMLEIWSDIIISLVFRLQIMPPDILVRATLDKYAKGLSNKPKIKQHAERMLRYL